VFSAKATISLRLKRQTRPILNGCSACFATNRYTVIRCTRRYTATSVTVIMSVLVSLGVVQHYSFIRGDARYQQECASSSVRTWNGIACGSKAEQMEHLTFTAQSRDEFNLRFPDVDHAMRAL